MFHGIVEQRAIGTTDESGDDATHIPQQICKQDVNRFSPLLSKYGNSQQHTKRSGNSIHSSSISLSPRITVPSELNLTSNVSILSSETVHNQGDAMSDMDVSIKQRNSDPYLYHALKQAMNFLVDTFSDSTWKSKWSLAFDESPLEHYFKIYFAHRHLLGNQAAFLMFALFYIIILFIFEVQSKYEWISVTVHCTLIVIMFVTLILSLTDQFRIHIHRLTSVMMLIILIGLDIQAVLAEMPISAQSILTLTLFLLGCCSFLSIRYNHLIVIFTLFFALTNIAFIAIVLNWPTHLKYTRFTYFIWFDMLLLFAMSCAAHLVRLFEMQERKQFLRVLRQMQDTKKTLQRQLTLYETVSIAQLVDNDRTGHDNDVLDKLFQRFIAMGGLLQHLPDIEEDDAHAHADDEYGTVQVQQEAETEHMAMHRLYREGIAVAAADGAADDEAEQDDGRQSMPSLVNVSFIGQTSNAQLKLCKFKDLPDFYNGYPYVPIGYRLNYSYKEAIHSVLQWHNETVNMWTEIAPLMLNVFCLAFFMSNDVLWLELMSTEDRCVFMFASVLVLVVRPVCSLLAHTFYPISKKAHEFWWRVDYTSICVTMLCEGVVSGNFTFSCNEQLKILFFTFVTCMFASTMLSILVSRSMQIRAASFCLFVIFATGCPFLYQWISFAQTHDEALFQYLSLWSISYVLAVIALSIKSLWFPERCCAQRRNCLAYVGASHQVWHVLINSCLSLSVYCWVVYLRSKYAGSFTCSQQ